MAVVTDCSGFLPNCEVVFVGCRGFGERLAYDYLRCVGSRMTLLLLFVLSIVSVASCVISVSHVLVMVLHCKPR